MAAAPTTFTEAVRAFKAAKEAAAAIQTPIFVLYGVDWEISWRDGDGFEEPTITEKQRAFDRVELEAAAVSLTREDTDASLRTLWLIREHILCADGTLLPAASGGTYTVVPWVWVDNGNHYTPAIREEPLVWRSFQGEPERSPWSATINITTTDPAPLPENSPGKVAKWLNLREPDEA